MRLKNGGWPYDHAPWGFDFEINHYSEQAKGLVFWVPLFGTRVVGAHSYKDRILKRVLTEGGAPTWIADATFGNSLLFDDVASDYISMSSPVLTAPPMTMSAWYDTDVNTLLETLVFLGDTGTNNNFHRLTLGGNAAGDPVQAVSNDGISGIAETSAGFSVNVRQHGCAVFTSSTLRAAYLNGGSKGTDATDVTPAGIDSTAIGARLRIALPANFMSGSITDVRIHNLALSDAGVFALYDQSTKWELYKPIIPMFAGVTIPSAVTRIPRQGFINFQAPSIL